MLAAAVLLLFAGRHLTFFYDEWSFILDRRGGSLDTYLDPHNGHLVLVPVAIYKLLLATVGLRHYWPFLAVTVLLHLVSCALLFMLLRRRVGDWMALVPTALLLFMGSAYQDLLWPFQMTLLASVAAGLAALTVMDRPTRFAELATAALLTLALACSGVGVAFLIASAVLLLARGTPWRRWWAVIVPGALFLVWYAGWGTSEHVTSDSVLAAPQYVADAAAGVAAGIAGLSSAWGPPLAIAGLAGLSVAWGRWRGAALTPMLLTAAAGVLSFWVLAAITRADVAQPDASRYLYVGAVFVFLISAEALGQIRIRRGWLALGGLLVAAALIANVGVLRRAERGLRASDESVRASLAALQIAAPVVAPTFAPEPVNAPRITAGSYLAATRDLGSPALALPELLRASSARRANSDSVLEHAERLVVAPAERAGRCAVSASPARDAASPVRGAVLTLTVPPGSRLVFRTAGGAPAVVELARIAASFPSTPFAVAPGGATSAIQFPSDRAPQLPWHAHLLAPRPLTACVL